MTFFPIGECCLKGTILPGEPKGVIEPASSTLQVERYHAKPSEVIDDKAAVVLFYDAFGFNVPNNKLLADRYAEELKINVFMPNYFPNSFSADKLDPVVESYPGEHKNRSWFATFSAIFGALRIIPALPGIRQSVTLPVCEKALQDLKNEGYERIGGIGYCLGGSQLINLMAKGDDSVIKAGVINHPGPESIPVYEKITKPTRWLMSEIDMRFKEPQLAEVRKALEGKPGIDFEMKVYPDTVHGFAARPNLSHEPTKKAFEDAGSLTVEFLRKQLLK